MPRTPDHISSKSTKDWQLDDEHLLIATFCQALQDNFSLSGGMIHASDFAMQFERDIDLEQVLYQLNTQNNRLTQEYETLSKEVANGTTQKDTETNGTNLESSERKGSGQNEKQLQEDIGYNKCNEDSEISKCDNSSIDEAAKLRQHSNRMETRIAILVDHNKQLESQLGRLRQLVQLPDEAADVSLNGSKFGTLRSKVVRETSLQSQSQEYDSGKSKVF